MGPGSVLCLSLCVDSETLRLEFRSYLPCQKPSLHLFYDFLLPFPLNMELNMANLKKKKKKDYCLSAAWQALWELSDGFGGQLSNYHHTLKFLLVSPYPCWFLLTLRICWWFQNPFWRHKVFLFLVSSRSSFPYIHISSSLDFSPVLHNRVITMVPFFLPCWVCTWNIICCITFFFFFNRKSSERTYYNIKPPCNKR